MDFNQIISELKQKSQEQKISTGASFKCSKCKDVGFIHQGDNKWLKCDCRVKEELEQRFINAGVNLNEIKNIEDYKIYNTITAKAKNITEKYLEEFGSIKGTRENGITFMGQAGGGKTFLCLIMAKELIKQGISVRYMPYLEVTRTLKALTRDNVEYTKKFNEYVNCDVLIIDDLFKNKIFNNKLKNELTEADLNHIMPIINQRYINHKPMIISTECRAEHLIELDGATGGRILEASKYTATFDSGCNYRLKKYMCKE